MFKLISCLTPVTLSLKQVPKANWKARLVSGLPSCGNYLGEEVIFCVLVSTYYPVGLDKCLKLPALSSSSGELIPEDTPVGRKPYGAGLAGHLQFFVVTESIPSRMCQDGYSNSIIFSSLYGLIQRACHC